MSKYSHLITKSKAELLKLYQSASTELKPALKTELILIGVSEKELK